MSQVLLKKLRKLLFENSIYICMYITENIWISKPGNWNKIFHTDKFIIQAHDYTNSYKEDKLSSFSKIGDDALLNRECANLHGSMIETHYHCILHKVNQWI